MLENYYEEIGRKRRERWVFWIIVWMLSTFLYLFFQGYYPYVRLDMGKFFEEDRPVAKPQVVRAFGIINVMAIPIPDAITVSSSTFGTKIIPNDDKGFFDFGTYSIRVEKDGYLPISLRATLSKEDSFSISVLELFKRPLYAPFPIPADFAEDLGGGRILVRERAMTWSTLTGSIYRILDSKEFGVLSSFRTDAVFLWGTLFEKRGIILSYDEWRGLVPIKMKTASGEIVLTPCEEASLEGEEIVCPKTGVNLLPYEATLKSRIFGAAGRVVKTESETSHVQGGREISKEKILSQSGSAPGNPVRIAKNQYRLSGGELVPVSVSKTAPSDFRPLSSIASVHDFGNESIVLGYSDENAAFVLVDERSNSYSAIIGRSRLSDIRMEFFHGAYLVSDGKALYLYYKGAEEMIKLIDGKMLWLFESTVLFEKEGSTYRLELIAGE